MTMIVYLLLGFILCEIETSAFWWLVWACGLAKYLILNVKVKIE